MVRQVSGKLKPQKLYFQGVIKIWINKTVKKFDSIGRIFFRRGLLVSLDQQEPITLEKQLESNL